MMGLQVHLDMSAQRRSLVAGALDHRHVQSGQGVLQRLRPGRRHAIRRVRLQQDKARHRLQRDQTDLGMDGLILTHRHRAVRHARGPRGARFTSDRAHRLLQGDIERVLAAIGGPDERRQPAQLQEFAHHPHPRTALQGDAEVRRQHDLMQPLYPLRGVNERRQGRGGGLRQSCKVLRARPRSAATCRNGSPAASRAAASSRCCARSRRERHFMTTVPPTTATRTVAPAPCLG